MPHASLSPLKQPSAVLPLVMSGFALTIVLVHIVLFGTARQADEGAEAHLWQLLIAGQLPLIVFFVARSISPRRKPLS